ncbi:hypothetical protein CDN99_16595 [Roseateles aquatilis]|uniref:Pilus assembly protein n=1 Tax=Roseateles aquatilis TaxID=431061 RepID=A0A246J7E3_9BURK|nr:hypothetical protein CDN99_16595 [Roseateles aquatilis]
MISCLLVAATVAAVVLLVWYPWPYRIVSGGENLLLLVMTVDVIMGPLITLVIFDIRKPLRELRRDMAIIVVLQLAALAYGVHTVYAARPVVLALENDRFRVSIAAGVAVVELDKAPEGLRSLSLTGPRLVGVAQPEGDERFDAVMMGLAGVDLGARPKYWRHWDADARRRALAVGKPLVDWLKPHPTGEQDVRQAAERTGLPPERLLYIPMLARRTDWSVLVDRTTGDVVGFAPIDGF